MKDFSHLTKRNAKDYFDAYLERKDTVLNEFIEETSKGINIKELNFNPDSLVFIWGWLSPKLSLSNEHPNKELMPMWYDIEVRNNKNRTLSFTQETAKWIDGMAYYFAETLLKNIAGGYWAIEEDKRCAYYNKPIITGTFYEIPLHKVIVASLVAIDKEPHHSDKRLLEIFEIAAQKASK